MYSSTPCLSSHLPGASTTGPVCPATCLQSAIHSSNGRRGPTALYVPVVPASAQASNQPDRSLTSMTCVGASGVSGTNMGSRGSRAARATQAPDRPVWSPGPPIRPARATSSRSPTSARDVILEAIRRLVTGTDPVQGLPVLVVSSIAAGVMVVGTVILGADAGSEDLHMRSVLLDTVSDAVTSAAVAGTGAIIYLTHGWFWLDPVISIVIGVVIGYGAVRLLGDVIAAVRPRTPLQVSDD